MQKILTFLLISCLALCLKAQQIPTVFCPLNTPTQFFQGQVPSGFTLLEYEDTFFTPMFAGDSILVLLDDSLILRDDLASQQSSFNLPHAGILKLFIKPDCDFNDNIHMSDTIFIVNVNGNGLDTLGSTIILLDSVRTPEVTYPNFVYITAGQTMVPITVGYQALWVEVMIPGIIDTFLLTQGLHNLLVSFPDTGVYTVNIIAGPCMPLMESFSLIVLPPAPLFYVEEPVLQDTVVRESNVIVYPNPAKDYVSVKGSYAKIEVYDLMSRFIFEQERQDFHDISNLSAGTYIISVVKQDWTREKMVLIKE